MKTPPLPRPAIFLIAAFSFVDLSGTFAQQIAETRVDSNGNAIPEAERVIVTGSNIPTGEEVGPNPVDTYRRDDITRFGVRTPTDFVERLPAAFGATSNDNNTATTGDAATHISLRGIDPKETLILQDGRRLATMGLSFPAVDFNVFPLGLIDHIDVLKDGASPVYGTDAVAGVVNVFLIHKFRGLEVYASYGNTNLGFANDMGQEVAYLLAGSGDDKTDIVVYAGLFNEAAIYARDVNVSDDADETTFGGSDGRSGIFAGRVTTRVFKGLEPASSGLKLDLKSPTPHASANQFTDTQYTSRTSLPRERQLFNFNDYFAEIPPIDREYLYGSVTRDICDKYLTLFADFKYVRQFVDAELSPRPFREIWTDADHRGGISATGFSVPIQNPFNPFTVPDYISPGGFDSRFPQSAQSAAPAGTAFTTGVRYRDLQVPFREKQTTDNYLFTGGIEGTLGEFANVWDLLKTWEWEAAVRWNEDFRTQTNDGAINPFALRAALLDTNPATAFNPFGLSNNSKSVLDRVFATTHEFGWVDLLTEDFKLNGDLFNLPGGAVSFAIGTEHLTNHLSDNFDSLGFSPTKGSVDSWAQYWELQLPVTGTTWNFPGAHSLEFDYAERYENYSSFGDTLRPKFSVRWQPFGGSPAPITLRAAYIEAFHAPSLVDLFGGTIEFFQFIHDPISSATEPQVEVEFTSNPNLKPEIAYERTFGAVLTPEAWWSALHGLTVSVDYGHIDVREFEVNQLDPQFVVDHESEFPGFVVRDPNAGNQIVLIRIPTLNLGRFIESYIDYEAVETFETARLGHADVGTLTATFNGTYLADVDIQALPNGKRTTVVGKFGGGFQGPSGGGNFTHNRWYASLFYDGPPGSWLQGIDAGAVVHYTGQYWDNADFTFFDNRARPPFTGPCDPGNGIPCIGSSDRKVREWTTLDLIVNYTFNLPSPTAQTEVAGYAKDGAKSVKINDGKDKKVLPLSTAEYNPCGWRAWLNQMTVTLGVDNVFDSEPPFVAAAAPGASAGFDQASANAKGRFWYVALKKRF